MHLTIWRRTAVGVAAQQLRIFVSSLYWQGHSAMDQRTCSRPTCSLRRRQRTIVRSGPRAFYGAAASYGAWTRARWHRTPSRGDTRLFAAVLWVTARTPKSLRDVELTECSGLRVAEQPRASAAIVVFQVNTRFIHARPTCSTVSQRRTKGPDSVTPRLPRIARPSRSIRGGGQPAKGCGDSESHPSASLRATIHTPPRRESDRSLGSCPLWAALAPQLASAWVRPSLSSR